MLVSKKQHQILKVSDTQDFSKSSWLTQIPVPNETEYEYNDWVTISIPAQQEVAVEFPIYYPTVISGVQTYITNLNITKFEVYNSSEQAIFVMAYSPPYKQGIVLGNPIVNQIQDFVYYYKNLVPESGVLFTGTVVIDIYNFGNLNTTVTIHIQGWYSYYNIGQILKDLYYIV